jgi:hypothetical protein
MRILTGFSGKYSLTVFLFGLILFLSGCEVVGGIFKAGMVWGIFLVVVIIAAIIYLISRGKGK